MFPKKYRLPIDKKVRFQKAFSTPYFLLKVSPGTIGHNRLGVIISNTAVKKSHGRHFWKRQFAEQIRLWPNLGKDFLIIVSPKIENISRKELKSELEKILKILDTRY